MWKFNLISEISRECLSKILLFYSICYVIFENFILCSVSHFMFFPHFICSASKGWLNPPLRFDDEPCRHKVLDLIGDLSLLARSGSQGLPIAHIVVYKAHLHPFLSLTILTVVVHFWHVSVTGSHFVLITWML